jgi:acetyltransferase-like isoleucine patch superfamily enzyme
MSQNIDPTAIIYSNAIIGDGVIVEPFAIIGIHDRFHSEAQTVIGNNAFIGSRCTIYDAVTTGDDFDLSDQSSVFYDNIFGDRCRIGPKAVIKNGCRLGNDVRIQSHAFMERVVLGSNVFIGPGVVFTDDRHPPCPRNAECTPVTTVEDFVSIGANATIVPGVHIGHHCQIYAGATIIGDVDPYSVMAGNPARRIKDFRDLTCEPQLYDHPFEDWDVK